MQYSNYGSLIGTKQEQLEPFMSVPMGGFLGQNQIGGQSSVQFFKNPPPIKRPRPRPETRILNGIGYNDTINEISQLGTYKFPRSMIQQARDSQFKNSSANPNASDLSKYGFQSVAT